MLTKWLKTLAVILCCSLSFGCTSGLMIKSNKESISSPGANMATIVFMRSSFVSSAISAELFEIQDGEMKFVGSIPNGSKIAHVTEPGEKVYMAYGTAADFMIAKVDGGKTYYSIVRPNWGTGGFAPTPVRKDASTDYNMNIKEFSEWKNSTELLEKTPDAEEWFTKNKDRYKEIYDYYWARFMKKTEAQKKERTLQPADGV